MHLGQVTWLSHTSHRLLCKAGQTATQHRTASNQQQSSPLDLSLPSKAAAWLKCSRRCLPVPAHTLRAASRALGITLPLAVGQAGTRAGDPQSKGLPPLRQAPSAPHLAWKVQLWTHRHGQQQAQRRASDGQGPGKVPCEERMLRGTVIVSTTAKGHCYERHRVLPAHRSGCA